MNQEREVHRVTQYQGILITKGGSIIYEPYNVMGLFCSDIRALRGKVRTAKTTNIATCVSVAVQERDCAMLIHAYTPLHLDLLLTEMVPELRKHAPEFTAHILSRKTRGTKFGAYLPDYDEVLDNHGVTNRQYHLVRWGTKMRVGKKNPAFQSASAYLSHR